MIGHWIIHFTGLDNGSGRPYLFWSGFEPDLTQLALIGAVLGAYRKHQCHQGKCWRIGRHVVSGTPWCNKHHERARKEGINA